jgi:hypothetical protein
LTDSGLPLAAILDSGNKSIHGWVRVDAPDRQEYDHRRGMVWDYFKGHNLDPQNKNPSRYSRAPSVERNLYDKDGNIIGVGCRMLLALNVGAATWDEWELKQNQCSEEELRQFEQELNERYRRRERPFPAPMHQDAFYGLAGDIVQIIEPESEACPEAILAQLLVALGNLIGRAPMRRQAGIHHVNGFTVLVGATARGRKGTAWQAVQNLLLSVDPDWLANRLRDGFQSGESIIHALRDEITGLVPIHKRKACQAHKTQTTVLDEGVGDKRLLILEEEFARLLIVGARTGNTLFEILRKAWDGLKWLHNEAKNSPEKATGAHVSLIGHITLPELAESLREVENQNGVSNRILWIAAQRAKKISIPRWIDWNDYSEIVSRLQTIVQTFKAVPERPMRWSDAGKAAWDKFYKSVPESGSGILGVIIARSDAHVLRLSMLFAILDHSSLLEPQHLKAAIAFWQYCERSAQ